MRASFVFVILLAVVPAHADWLLDSMRAASAATSPGQTGAPAPATEWIAYEPPSRLFRADLPPEGWNAYEEEDALGTVVRAFGPDDPSGALRATLSVRLIDRDAPNFLPAKEAVESMRQSKSGREVSPVRPLRLPIGLARVFEIVETRRLPVDSGPSSPLAVHQYIAVIPRGSDYFLVRLVTARSNYLDFRDDFTRFLRSFRPIGAR